MKIYHNEIEPQCCEVLRKQFPHSFIDDRSIEDVQPEELSEYRQCHFFAGIGGFSLGFRNAGVSADTTVWTGGFPCQDLSIAGKRKGLAGSRSGLYFEFHRLFIKSLPNLIVIENVPGLLSSNEGKDFAIVIGGLTGVIPEVPDDGWGNAGVFKGRYTTAYRVLDAQFYGVAQRRRRVFIVGSLGNGRAAEVLFESESGAWDTAPSREAGQGTAVATLGHTKSNGLGVGIQQVSNTIETISSANQAVAFDGRNMTADEEKTVTLQAKNQGGYSLNYTPMVYQLTGDRDRPSLSSYDNVHPTISANPMSDRTPFVAQRTVGALQARDGKGIGTTIDDKIVWHENQGGNFAIDEEGLAKALKAGASHSYQGVGVRRLTPTECARLQGFPDTWNDFLSDSARYRQFGNAVAVPVAEWIGKRIMEIEHGYKSR